MQKSKKIIIILSAIIVVLILVVILAVINKNRTENASNPSRGENKIAQKEAEEENDVYAKNADFEEIAKDIEKKKGTSQIEAEDLIKLGVSYYNMNKLDRAVGAYKEAIEKDPQNALAYGNLGNVLRDKGDYREAEEQFRKAIEISPGFVSAYVSLAVMFRSLEDDKVAALQVLSQGLANNPGNGILQNLLDNYKKT